MLLSPSLPVRHPRSPPCKAFLTHVRRTNYDKRGRLCWALSDDEKKERKRLLHAMAQEEMAAAKVQAVSRGAARLRSAVP